MASIDEERLEARRKAQERQAQSQLQGAKAMAEYENLRKAEIAKTARLRALRLTKEEADKRDAVAKAAVVAEKKPKIRRRAPRTPESGGHRQPGSDRREARAMMAEAEIHALARTLIGQHGQFAPREAEERAKRMSTQGDPYGVAHWLRVKKVAERILTEQ